LTVALMLALAGCGLGRVTDAGSLEFALNEAFSIGGGQEATIIGENLSVSFTDVLEDSRTYCGPRGSLGCDERGEARIVIRVRRNGQEPTPVEFTLNPDRAKNVNVVTVYEHTVALWSLEPHQTHVDKVLKLEDYRVSLVVQKPQS
jgi:hypothetical protein